MIHLTLFVLLILFSMFPPAHGNQKMQQPIKIYAEELPPYNFLKEKLVHGISTDLLIRMMAEANNPVDRSMIRIVPWARGYRTVQTEADTMLYSTARTEQREKLFQWVGPIMSLTIGLISLKDNKIKIQSPEDLTRYKIGTVRDGAPEQLVVKSGIREKDLKRLSSPVQCIKMLTSDRIDMFAFNIPTTIYLLIEMGLDPGKYETIYILKQADLYYAFHKETKKELIIKLNAILKQLKTADTSGKSEFDMILETYLGDSGK